MAFALKIGSRPSRLAMAQAATVRDRLAAAVPGLKAVMVQIRTSGDRMTSASLAQVGGKGLFIKELEQALSEHAIDIAVHSMKDLPAVLAPQFRIAAVPERQDPRDAIATRDSTPIEKLGTGARLGTSSLRRRLQALRINRELAIVPLRGNVDTRLKRVSDGELDAVILALAGIRRLGPISDLKILELDERRFIPAGGQGALAVETLADGRLGRSSELERAMIAIDDARAHYETAAERALLATIGASCATPVGVRARIEGATLMLRAILFSIDGSREIEEAIEEPADVDLARSSASEAGERLGERMIARGASELIAHG